jgi:hypothetical protein
VEVDGIDITVALAIEFDVDHNGLPFDVPSRFQRVS